MNCSNIYRKHRKNTGATHVVSKTYGFVPFLNQQFCWGFMRDLMTFCGYSPTIFYEFNTTLLFKEILNRYMSIMRIMISEHIINYVTRLNYGAVNERESSHNFSTTPRQEVFLDFMKFFTTVFSKCCKYFLIRTGEGRKGIDIERTVMIFYDRSLFGHYCF